MNALQLCPTVFTQVSRLRRYEWK